jgi:hypothetical protein
MRGLLEIGRPQDAMGVELLAGTYDDALVKAASLFALCRQAMSKNPPQAIAVEIRLAKIFGEALKKQQST